MSPSPWRHERRQITCCKDCKPPKRYPGCGDHCPEYKKEKAQLKADKERERKDKEKNPVLKHYDFNKL
jgi:hypothetical protein